MAQISTIRHQSIFDPIKYGKLPISIIGVGATGSRVFASLVELGCTNINLFDFDKVESHNLANQLYIYDDIGSLKVVACADWYKQKTSYDAPDTMRFTADRVPNEHTAPTGYVFLLTDTMASRREIAEACFRNNGAVLHVFETRMASSYGNVFNFNPAFDLDKWLATLTNDDEAEVSPCGTSISVGPTASIIANLAVWQFMTLLTDPALLEPRMNVFLNPPILATEKRL
jgi:molybdopterin/thiamine biosynthesis adenylyltransferase